MSQCQSIEEILRGPDGQAAKGIRPKLEEMVAKARADGQKEIEVEIRSTPASTTNSRSEKIAHFSVDSPLEAVIEALRRALEDSPGDAFAGEIRLNFRTRGDSSGYMGSFTRHVRPPQLTLAAAAAPAEVSAARATFEGMVKPLGDQNLRQSEAGTRVLESAAKMMDAAARMLEAHQGPRSSDPKAQLLGELVRGTMSLGAANNVNPAGSPVAPTPVASEGSPPGPSNGSPPSSSTTSSSTSTPTVDEAAVRTWLKNNPGRAQALGSEMLDQFGFTIVPKGMA